jgi:adenosylcobinamide-phosphate synthase
MSAVVIAAAWGLDVLLGDPETVPHPVRGIGRLITALEPWVRKRFSNAKYAGVAVGMLVPVIAYAGTAAVIWLCGLVHFWLATAASVLLIYTTLSSRCLSDEARAILRLLLAGDIVNARKQLSRIVGRDTQDLNEKGIARATIESVSENSVDGIIAPLFYAVLGGAPLAMAYKAINTLDSMVGYKDDSYREFGWFSARMDDVANFIPARLCLIIIPIATIVLWPSRAVKSFAAMLRDGTKNPSPNSGYPEAGFAGALGIQLGGDTMYKGVVHQKQFLGDKEKDIEAEDIGKSMRLMWAVSCAALVILTGAGSL